MFRSIASSEFSVNGYRKVTKRKPITKSPCGFTAFLRTGEVEEMELARNNRSLKQHSFLSIISCDISCFEWGSNNIARKDTVAKSNREIQNVFIIFFLEIQLLLL